MQRFTRMVLGFSKKVENLAAATAIHIAVYNFCRIHGSLKCTPAMAAGVIDKLWDMNDLYAAVADHAERKRREAQIAKRIDRLRREGR
jgi:hypothetical protein